MLRSAGSLVVFEGSNGNHNNGSEWTAAKGVGLETAIARGPRVVAFVLLAAASSYGLCSRLCITEQHSRLPDSDVATAAASSSTGALDPDPRTLSCAC